MRMGLGGGIGRRCRRKVIVPVTLNPLDMDPALVLSNGNLTVTNTDTADTGAENVRATRSVSRTGGKFYFECLLNIFGPNPIYTGLASPTHPLSSSLGQGTTSYGVNISGDTYFNGVSTNSGVPDTTLPFRVAYDGTTGKVWLGFTVSGGTLIWAGGGDPAAGTSPTFTYAGSEVLFPAITLRNNNDQATINFGASAFAYAVPASYNAWKLA